METAPRMPCDHPSIGYTHHGRRDLVQASCMRVDDECGLFLTLFRVYSERVFWHDTVDGDYGTGVPSECRDCYPDRIRFACCHV